jgi:hypothetical protein
MVAAAVIAAGAISAVGAGVAGSEAAGATKSAANTAANEQQWALLQQEGVEQPYMNLGQSAIGQYQNLLGIGSGGTAGELAALQKTPGYQFTQQQGETGILNAASASGGLSGNTLTALDQYNTGLADQTYQSALSNAQSAVTIGQNAASNTGAAISNAGNNLSNIATNAGNNLANIDIGEAAGISNAVGNAGNQYVENQTIGSLLNPGGGGNTYTSQYSPGGSGGYIDSSDGYQEN